MQWIVGASSEHELQYKNRQHVSTEITNKLKLCADQIAETDLQDTKNISRN